MKLSIIIPVFNEEKNISKVLDMVKNAPIDVEKEIIVVDDCSSDKTAAILKEIRRRNIKIIFQEKNLGKGAAIRRGLKEVTGDIVLIQDADFEYDIDDYSKILGPIIYNKAEVVYGSRFLGKITGMRWQNRLANKILTFMANLLFGTHITDEATAYKAFRTKIIKNIPLKCQRFEFCPEVTAKIAKKGIKIFEVPITYKGRTLTQGKKIHWKDGFSALWTLIKYRIIN